MKKKKKSQLQRGTYSLAIRLCLNAMATKSEIRNTQIDPWTRVPVLFHLGSDYDPVTSHFIKEDFQKLAVAIRPRFIQLSSYRQRYAWLSILTWRKYNQRPSRM